MIGSKTRVLAIKRLSLKQFKSFSTQFNRWQYYYANGDGNHQMDTTSIEVKQFSQPYEPKEHYATKVGNPSFYFPEYVNDFRYNYKLDRIPHLYTRPLAKQKVYDPNDINALYHGNEWVDMQPDYQIEEPMSSNHYYQGSPHYRVLYLITFFGVFAISKIIKVIFSL